MYICPRANCRKQYRQMSGLRYHVAHVRVPRRVRAADLTCRVYIQGHPAELPAQLDVVPPALVRKMAEKAQAKGSSTE